MGRFHQPASKGPEGHAQRGRYPHTVRGRLAEPYSSRAGLRKPVISLDVAATAVSLAGLPQDPTLDGVNLMPFLTGANPGAPRTRGPLLALDVSGRDPEVPYTS